MQFNIPLLNTSIRKKISYFFIIFLCVLLYFMSDSYNKESAQLREYQKLSEHFVLAFSISDLIIDLQRERGLITGYISAEHDDEFSNNIQKQKDKTQITISKLHQSIRSFTQTKQHELLNNAQYIAFINLLNLINDKNHIAHDEDDESFHSFENAALKFKYYSQLIKEGLNIIQIINNLISNQELSRLYQNYMTLQLIQEMSGQERAIIMSSINTNKMNASNFQKLSAVTANQQSLLDDFKINADDKYTSILINKLKDPKVIKTNLIVQNIIDRMPRQEILTQIQQLIGYGGLIHLFKNYLIRFKPEYYTNFLVNHFLLEDKINEIFNQNNSNEYERDLLQTIRDTFLLYKQKIEFVKQQHDKKIDFRNIDIEISIDDFPALEAINTLKNSLTHYDTSNWWEISTHKVNQFILISNMLEKQLKRTLAHQKQLLTQEYYRLISFILFSILTIAFFSFILYRRMVNDVNIISNSMAHGKKIAPELQKHNDELTSMAHTYNQLLKSQTEHAEELKAALIKAEAGIVSKSQFLSTMSHEIRTPLNGVLGMAELVANTKLDDEQKNYVNTILNSGNLLLRIINDILDFSKLEANAVSIEHIACNVETTAYDSLQLLMTKASEKNIELLYSYPLDIPTHFIADPSRLRQVLLNLLSNSLKFTETGYVFLEITANHISQTHYQLTFSVKDTGIGIEQTAQAKLFESFTQAEQSTTRKYGGTGLGLSISQQIVELMGGKIKIDSTPGKGSNFYFSIDLQIDSHPTPKLTSSINLEDIRLLAVDDNTINLSIISELCQHFHLECITNNKPETVVEFLQKEYEQNRKIDVIILDHHMPIINGIELSKQIKKDPRLRDIKLMLLTSSGMRGDAKKCLKLGFSAYLTKPIRQELLIQSIKQVITESGDHNEILTSYHVEDAIALENTENIIIHDAKILLAEDNLINQKVAQAVLKKIGLTADIANNGDEAYNMYQNKDYDLIFMDCQMPVLNGFEATQKIRSFEDNTKKHIPIVALTANALAEDQERCMASGMDDFIAKPFKKSDILTALNKWLD